MTKSGRPGRKRNKWIWWAICPAVSAVLFLYLFWRQGGFSALTDREILRLACDGCFVCGMIFGALFIIGLCAYWGAFDFLQYSAKILSDSLFSKNEEDEERVRPDFMNYANGKAARRRLNLACLVFAVVFLVAGFVLLAVYMQ